jgi:hypothetical protein
MATTTKKKKKNAIAFLASSENGDEHIVGVGNLRVVIVPDGGAFFAQGLEIDYAAQGASVEAVKKNFEKGFEATIQQHLQIYGNLKNFLVPAPVSIWQEMLPEKVALHKWYSQVSVHKIDVASLPYEGIRYLVAAAAVHAT